MQSLLMFSYPGTVAFEKPAQFFAFVAAELSVSTRHMVLGRFCSDLFWKLCILWTLSPFNWLDVYVRYLKRLQVLLLVWFLGRGPWLYIVLFEMMDQALGTTTHNFSKISLLCVNFNLLSWVFNIGSYCLVTLCCKTTVIV